MATRARGKKRKKPLRAIAEPRVIPAPSGVSIRTRLQVSDQDEVVLRAVGEVLTRLTNEDLVRAIDGTLSWAERKNLLTPECSARWSGTITRANNDQVSLSRRNLLRSLESDRSAARTITRRLALPVMSAAARKTAGLKAHEAGYETRQEVAGKKTRLGMLTARIVRTESELDHLSICRGGKKLLNTRHNLEDAGITQDEWRSRWDAKRRFLSANGESGKRGGNETICVDGNGRLLLDLPPAMAHLANQKHGRYRLDAAVVFPYRGQEWAARIAARQATSYRIREDPEQHRWYLDASWTVKVKEISTTSDLTLGIDLNADHLACMITDASGNPVGAPIRIPLDLKGCSTSTRDGRIRAAISEIVRICQQRGIGKVAIEDLGFAGEATRENLGHNKAFRHLISGFPSEIFKARVAAMLARNSIILVAVDPAYTSKWGGEHWQPALHTPGHKATRHEGAAVVIGRRANGYGACRQRNSEREQRIARTPSRVAQASHPASRDRQHPARHRGTHQTPTATPVTVAASRAENRSRPALSFSPPDSGMRFVGF